MFCGLLILIVRSLIHVCVPVRPTTLTSVIVPAEAMFNVEVTVGAPLDGITTGTFALAKFEQLLVVNDHEALKLFAKHELYDFTCQ